MGLIGEVDVLGGFGCLDHMCGGPLAELCGLRCRYRCYSLTLASTLLLMYIYIYGERYRSAIVLQLTLPSSLLLVYVLYIL